MDTFFLSGLPIRSALVPFSGKVNRCTAGFNYMDLTCIDWIEIHFFRMDTTLHRRCPLWCAVKVNYEFDGFWCNIKVLKK